MSDDERPWNGTDSQTTRRHTTVVYVLILVAFFACQFGHGSNIGVAVSLPGNSKAMNLALGSWVMVGVCLGLPLVPWACRTFGEFNVSAFCVVMDIIAMLLMTYPGMTIHQIYVVRFLVGFFEAPFLPYLQEWLAHFGKHTWNVWNSLLHAMVPLGENVGFILAQELVSAGYSWRFAFIGQAVAFGGSVLLCWAYGGRRYLDFAQGSEALDRPDDASAPSETEYPVTERWWVYWATNVSLAAQLGFLGGCKYVIRDYATSRGFGIHQVICTFSAIALIGPAIGGAFAMSVTNADKWPQHKRTLIFLACVSALAAGLAAFLPYVSSFVFWPSLFLTFIAAGCVYPAAQGIINIALTASRVIEASVYQVQCNNILFAMPMPYAIGKAMDSWSIGASFRLVAFFQVLAAAGFAFALLAADCTEERRPYLSAPRDNSPLDEETSPTNGELQELKQFVE